MNITLFNRNYWARRFGEQREIRGYITTGRRDFIVSLNVHPSGTDRQQANDEGERRIKRLEAHGTDELVAADQDTETKGDLLYYHGYWYECVNAQLWDHTVLNHINYSFVIVPDDAHGTIDLDDPPRRDPNKMRRGEGLFTVDGQLKVPAGDKPGFVMIPAGSGLTIEPDGSLALDSATADEIRRAYGEGVP